MSEIVVKGSFIKSVDFGEWNYDNEATPQNISMVLGMDYCILNY